MRKISVCPASSELLSSSWHAILRNGDTLQASESELLSSKGGLSKPDSFLDKSTSRNVIAPFGKNLNIGQRWMDGKRWRWMAVAKEKRGFEEGSALGPELVAKFAVREEHSSDCASQGGR